MTADKLDAEAFGKALASARLQTGDNTKPLATMFVTYRREANKNALADVMPLLCPEDLQDPEYAQRVVIAVRKLVADD